MQRARIWHSFFSPTSSSCQHSFSCSSSYPVWAFSFGNMAHQRTVALEFGFEEQVVDYILRQRSFKDAGELVDYLDQLHLTDNFAEVKARLAKEKVEDEKKQRNDLVNETRRLHINSKCFRCRKNDRGIVCLPCSHFSLCKTCAMTASQCPVCKMNISWTIPTFLS